MYDYEISVKLSDENVFVRDVIQFISMRFPLLKNSSFSLLTINLASDKVAFLQGQLGSSSKVPMAEITCSQLTDNKQSSIEGKKIVQNLIFNKPYNIAWMRPRAGTAETDYNDDLVITDILLISPTLHALSSSHLFNQSFNGLTAMQIVEEYQKFINERLKLNLNFIDNLGGEEHVSKFIYNDEILISGGNDLDVLQNIFDRYKITKHASVCFFDDFRYSLDSPDDDIRKCKDINVLMFNLGAMESFPPVNVGNQFPIIHTNTKFKKMDILNDYQARFYKSNPTRINSIGTNSVGVTPSSGKGVKMPAIQTTATKITLDKGVEFLSKTVKIQHNKVPESLAKNESIIINSPDDISLSDERYNKMLELYLQNVGYVATYEMQNIPIDALQFGKKYNLFAIQPDQYRFTPISICNEFVKKSSRYDTVGSILQHNATCQMIYYNYG